MKKGLVARQFACGLAAGGVLLGADLLAGPGAAAQSASTGTVTCSSTTATPSNPGNTTATQGQTVLSFFVCIADLTGDGIPEIIVGEQSRIFIDNTHQSVGHVYTFNPAGALRSRTCWGSTSTTHCPLPAKQ